MLLVNNTAKNFLLVASRMKSPFKGKIGSFI
jgi:hypothetical protein